MKLLIFDVGGVFRDSSRAINEGFRKGFESQGLDYNFKAQEVWNLRRFEKYNNSKKVITALMAIQRTDKNVKGILNSDNPEAILDKLIRDNIKEKDEKLIRNIRKVYKKFFNSEKAGKLMEKPSNLKEIMTKIKEKYRIAVWTNAQKETVKRDLREIFDIFELIVGEKTGMKKPSPDGIKYICDKLNVDIKDTGYVGDSIVDVLAAKRAGCISIALVSGMGIKKHLEKEKPDYIFKDLEELSNKLV